MLPSIYDVSYYYKDIVQSRICFLMSQYSKWLGAILYNHSAKGLNQYITAILVTLPRAFINYNLLFLMQIMGAIEKLEL